MLTISGALKKSVDPYKDNGKYDSIVQNDILLNFIVL